MTNVERDLGLVMDSAKSIQTLPKLKHILFLKMKEVYHKHNITLRDSLSRFDNSEQASTGFNSDLTTKMIKTLEEIQSSTQKFGYNNEKMNIEMVLALFEKEEKASLDLKSKLSAKIMEIFEEKSASFGAVLEKFADNDKALVD